jgi:hypothetical protein
MGFAVTSYEGYTPVVGLLNAQVESKTTLLQLNGSQTTLGINTFRYEQFKQPCTVMDNVVINKMAGINTNKDDIVTLGQYSNFVTYPKYYASSGDADTAVTTQFNTVLTTKEVYHNLNFTGVAVTVSQSISAGTAISSFSGATGVVAVNATATVGTALSVLVRNVSGNFGIGQTVYFGVQPGIAYSGGPSFVNYVGTGGIRNDNTIVTFYPDLEPPNTTVGSPFRNYQAKLLVTNMSGLGAANTFYSNSLSPNVIGSIVDCDDVIPVKGTVFAFNTVSGAAVKTQIDSEITEIGTQRTGITSYANSSSTIKGYKKGYASNIWALSKSNSKVQNSITDLNAAITILQDPAFGGPY